MEEIARKLAYLDSAIERLKSFAIGRIAGAVNDGWVAVAETWTYASANAFTISGDWTLRYSKGDKLKLTQTTVKYFYVVGVSYSAPNTTITVTGGTDYTLTNAAITLPFYSKAASPNGFPATGFAWTPTFAGASPAGTFTYSNQAARLHMQGSLATIFVDVGISAISVTPGGSMTVAGIPVANGGSTTGVSWALISNFNYATNSMQLVARIDGGGSTVILSESFDNAAFSSVPGASFTNASCRLIFNASYLV